MKILSDKKSFIIDINFLKNFANNEIESNSRIYYNENIEKTSFNSLFQNSSQLCFGIFFSKNDSSNYLIVSKLSRVLINFDFYYLILFLKKPTCVPLFFRI